ncbi:MAG: dehydratase [Chloroflexi bacterium]|nr:dehydratase [Chloroflexota bacterium]
MEYQPRGWYFEDFKVGQRVITAGRTVTEADIVAFAGLSGDYNRIHTDAEYAARTPFGQRIAHGLLVMSIASGLAAQTGFIEGTVIAFREIKDWKFAKPVYIGDTIHVELTVTETKLLRRLGGGAVTFRLEVKNQHGDTVMKGTWVVLIASRGE